MFTPHPKGDGTINLQGTLAAASATNIRSPEPHHPITCMGLLRLEEDGRFACEHVTVPAEDQRTQTCLNHSIALLLIETAVREL